MELERIFPEPGRVATERLPEELAFAARAGADRPFVALNMAATADGRTAVGGVSGPIGGAGDRALFGALRASVDAILVGSATVAAEGYGRLVRDARLRELRVTAGRAEDPHAILVTRSGELPWDAPLFAAEGQPVLVVCEHGAVGVPDGLPAAVEVVECDEPTPAAALRSARARGIGSVLCEGGPRLARALLADGLLDELFLTIGPLLAGGEDAPGVLAGPPLPEPVALALKWVLRHEDELLLRYEVDAGVS